MYEFVKTENGWRVFWGVDPLTLKRAKPVTTPAPDLPRQEPARDTDLEEAVVVAA